MKKTVYWILALVALACVVWYVSPSADKEPAADPVVTETPQEKSIFSDEINKLIDENYEKVMSEGWAELIIPAEMFNHDVFTFPEDAKNDMDYVVNAGHEVYIIGGSVRDAVLGDYINDADFVTDATPEELVEIVPNTKIFTTPGGYVVSQAWHGDDCTDMGTLRSVYSFFWGHPQVPPHSEGVYSKSVLEDSYGRDLTINAIYYDYKTGNIIDYHGGLHDLREGIIRTIYNPDVVFPAAPSDLLRAVRFVARFGFKIDPAVDAAIHKHLACCERLGADGITYVMIHGFEDRCMQRTYKAYKEYGLLSRFLPVLNGYLDNPEFEDYIAKAYADLDAQKCKKGGITLGALFLPAMQKAMGEQAWTEENLAKVWSQLEQTSGQTQFFKISDDRKADMYQYWIEKGAK